jgi:sugar phosphate isomerase/epimerase
VRIGTTLIAFVGWSLDTVEPEVGRRRHLDAVRTLVERYGIQAVELNGDFSVLYPHVLAGEYYDQVAALQQELGFTCTLHLPFLWQDGSSLAEPIRQATVQSVRQVLKWTQALDVESYVLHLWGLWTSVVASVQQMAAEEKQLLMDEILRRAARTLDELAAFVTPAKVCVENLERLPFDYVVPLIDERGMSICMDVGHLTVQGGDPLTFLSEHWDRIGEIHLHDAVRGGKGGPGVRDHLPLGDGSVDYVTLMDTLKTRRYDKVLILEVNTEAHLSQSLERVQPWL